MFILLLIWILSLRSAFFHFYLYMPGPFGSIIIGHLDIETHTLREYVSAVLGTRVLF